MNNINTTNETENRFKIKPKDIPLVIDDLKKYKADYVAKKWGVSIWTIYRLSRQRTDKKHKIDPHELELILKDLDTMTGDEVAKKWQLSPSRIYQIAKKHKKTLIKKTECDVTSLITELRAKGKSLREIALTVGCSHEQIRKILLNH